MQVKIHETRTTLTGKEEEMPYKISYKGHGKIAVADEEVLGLTEMQAQALEYLEDHRSDDRYIDAHEIATYYGYPSGNYFRGVLYSLWKRGLIEKEEE